MQNFSWIIDGVLAGMGAPGQGSALQEDARWLQAQNVGLLVSLSEAAPHADTLARFDIAPLHLPVRDFTAPSLHQIHRFIAETRMTIKEGKAVCVHCAAGRGRTGTMLAAWLIADGMGADAAIRRIRELRPGSIETPEQEDILHAYARELKR